MGDNGVLGRLKAALQRDADSAKLENLTAALVGQLLGVAISVARSGFQFGGDMGTVGRQGRRLRVECKCYGDKTRLSDRELRGEFDQAIARDPALEAWLLVTTRSAPEQLDTELSLKAEREGVPALIIDWKDTSFPALAALCASAPAIVFQLFNHEAGDLARQLQADAIEAIARLRRDLQAWQLGFEQVRARSHEKLLQVWNNPRSSNAALGQNAAGGADAHHLRREAVHAALDAWWVGPAGNDAPVAVVGYEGVGKTWATLDWLVAHLSRFPIVLVVPSSAVPPTARSAEGVKRFLGERLHELSGVADAVHWGRRLERLLLRPSEEGPALIVFFDGLNQEPSAPWLEMLKVLQADAFQGAVRVIVTTRLHFFEERLSRLKGLTVPPTPVSIDVYDEAAGGELDQRLAMEGLTRANLPVDLLPLARTPRLFGLVVRFGNDLVDAGQVTVHRLLWEYGRDSFAAAAGRAFSEGEWREWLVRMATQHRNGVAAYSTAELGATAARPDFTTSETYARLSDIIDGRFTTSQSGRHMLAPVVVTHALGAALLTHIDEAARQAPEALEAALDGWLDPIAGLDERAEILRAAISILVAQGATTSPSASALTTAWLQTQNVTDLHRRELSALAPLLVGALLDAVERSDERTHASARQWAINALRAVSSDDEAASIEMVERVRGWLSIVPINPYGANSGHAEHEQRRRTLFAERIGADQPGDYSVFGVPLRVVEEGQNALAVAAAAVLQGRRLAYAIPAFEAAAVAFAVGTHGNDWTRLPWLTLLNELDPVETAAALRLSAARFMVAEPEPDIDPRVAQRAAALVLWLVGEEADDRAAAALDPVLDDWPTYETDYLPHPSRSRYAVERRHADAVLTDTDVSLHARIGKLRDIWIDPTFEPPAEFVTEIRAHAEQLGAGSLYTQGFYTAEEHHFEALEPILARCAPDLLAGFARNFLLSLANRTEKQRYWASLQSIAYFLFDGTSEASSARALRLSGRESRDGEEFLAGCRLLLLELRGLEPATQFAELIEARLPNLLTDFEHVLGTPTIAQLEALVARFGDGDRASRRLLLMVLSFPSVEHYSDAVWRWLETSLQDNDADLQGLAFRCLTLADAARFGGQLLGRGWSWSADLPAWGQARRARSGFDADDRSRALSTVSADRGSEPGGYAG